MIGHQNFKSKSSSSSSSGSCKYLRLESIESRLSKHLQEKDLFESLLEECSASISEQNPPCCSQGMHLIQILNLSPRQSHERQSKELPNRQHMCHSSQNHRCPSSQQSQGCKCTKIDCLKLYCQCFAKGKVCGEHCICVCCHNMQDNIEEIRKAQSLVNYRHPNYFKGVASYVPARKCTCKKSMCRKKYCQCYNAGLKCTEECQCCDCHNGKPEPRMNFDSRMEIEVRA